MSTFPAPTGHRLIAALRKFGFEIVRIKGSHHLSFGKTKIPNKPVPTQGTPRLDPGAKR
uniref:HicA toxin of toxin-antitoxin n=1 Tax=Candidatus Kentrum sp. SD TaxID=2126332 RepID=A0A451BHZ4_9GAMM|nr:MAG: HicA toxin of toxin-antitoxin [Candidatus Kentron sp. SD]